MDWRTFESKLLASSAYDAGTHILYLRFRTGDVYRYFEFPEQQYREFLDAESRGRYFLSHIRNQFRYEKLAKLEAARSVGVLLVVRLRSLKPSLRTQERSPSWESRRTPRPVPGLA